MDKKRRPATLSMDPIGFSEFRPPAIRTEPPTDWGWSDGANWEAERQPTHLEYPVPRGGSPEQGQGDGGSWFTERQPTRLEHPVPRGGAQWQEQGDGGSWNGPSRAQAGPEDDSMYWPSDGGEARSPWQERRSKERERNLPWLTKILSLL